jgi:hypothetical protein
MTKEQLVRYLSEGLSLEQIGKRVERNPSTISYHLKKHGLRPVNKGKHALRADHDAAPDKDLGACAGLDRSVDIRTGRPQSRLNSKGAALAQE